MWSSWMHYYRLHVFINKPVFPFLFYEFIIIIITIYKSIQSLSCAQTFSLVSSAYFATAWNSGLGYNTTEKISGNTVCQLWAE